MDNACLVVVDYPQFETTVQGQTNCRRIEEVDGLHTTWKCIG